MGMDEIKLGKGLVIEGASLPLKKMTLEEFKAFVIREREALEKARIDEQKYQTNRIAKQWTQST